MEIKNSDLQYVKNSIQNILQGYGTEGRIGSDEAKLGFQALKQFLIDKISLFEYQAGKKKFPNYNSKGEESKQRALMILSSGSIDLVKDALKREPDNYDLQFYLMESCFKDKRYSDVDKSQLTIAYNQARIRSGYEEYNDYKNQAKVMLKEVEALENNIGMCGYVDLLSKSNMARSGAEIGYVLSKEKRQSRPAYVLYEAETKEPIPSYKEAQTA